MKLKFQKELFYHLMPELPPLFMAEWEEVIKDDPTQQQLSPAWDKYVQMEMTGLLQCFTARDENKLVGYILSIIHPGLHFSKTLYAYIDAFYLMPEYWVDDAAAELIKQNEALLKAEGVQRLNMAVPISARQYRLMKTLHYDRTECIFAKWL